MFASYVWKDSLSREGPVTKGTTLYCTCTIKYYKVKVLILVPFFEYNASHMRSQTTTRPHLINTDLFIYMIMCIFARQYKILPFNILGISFLGGLFLQTKLYHNNTFVLLSTVIYMYMYKFTLKINNIVLFSNCESK